MKKVNIPKDNLVELYNNQNLTMSEIAKIYGVDRSTISHRFEEYGIAINTIVRKFMNMKITSYTDLQKKLVIGSLLGDASVIFRGKNSYFKIGHCEAQKEYIEWKYEILKNFINRKLHKSIDKRDETIMYEFTTLTHSDLNYYRNLFYKDDIKIITNNLFNEVKDPLSLAVWYMDDGSCGKNSSSFSTCGFTKEENEILCKLLKVNFNITSKVSKYTKENNNGEIKTYYYLLLNKANTILLHEIIKPYIINCMKYKLFSQFH